MVIIPEDTGEPGHIEALPSQAYSEPGKIDIKQVVKQIGISTTKGEIQRCSEVNDGDLLGMV